MAVVVLDELDREKEMKKPQPPKPAPSTTVEDIYEIIGGFGRFQVFALLVTFFPEFPAGMIDFQPVFTSSPHRIQWLCTDTFGDTRDITNDSVALCGCNGTLDGGHGSIVAEWNLICEYAWIPDSITSVQMVGLILGDFLGVYLIDNLGRKKTLYLASFVTMFGSICSSLAPTVLLYTATRFFCGTGISVILFLTSIYPMEFLTPKWRSLCGSAGPWSEGIMCLSLFAYNFRSWRHLCLFSSLPMLIIFLTYPFLPESPRFLLVKGRTKEAKKVLKQIARWNNCPPLEGKIVEDLASSFHQQEKVHKLDQESIDDLQPLGTKSMKKKQNKIWRCLRDRKFLKKTAIFMSSWFTCLLLYYGIGFNAKNLSGDPYMNVFYMALVEVIGGTSAIFVSKWLGRKVAFGLYMGTATVCMINIILMEIASDDPGFAWPIENSDLSFNTSVFGGKMMAAAALGVINCFTSESYSTAQRSLGVGAANVAASLAAVLAPQMAYFGTVYKTGPYYLFAVASLSSTISILFLMETKGKPLNEDS